MIGLVLVTHGALAQEFVAALEHVVGKQEQLATISIAPDDNIENRRDDLIEAIKATNTGDGVIMVTDMFGGTPSNLAISVMDNDNLEVIAGGNLPMLIKIASMRKTASLPETVEQALLSGRKYINAASKLLED